MSIRGSAAALATIGLLWWTSAGSGQPRAAMQADFDACNREAERAVRAPSASPSWTPGFAPTGRSAPGTATPVAPPEPLVSGKPPMEPSGVGAAAPARSLAGMGPAGHGDPAYQRAYRDCMWRKAQ